MDQEFVVNRRYGTIVATGRGYILALKTELKLMEMKPGDTVAITLLEKSEGKERKITIEALTEEEKKVVTLEDIEEADQGNQ